MLCNMCIGQVHCSWCCNKKIKNQLFHIYLHVKCWNFDFCHSLLNSSDWYAKCMYIGIILCMQSFMAVAASVGSQWGRQNMQKKFTHKKSWPLQLFVIIFNSSDWHTCLLHYVCTKHAQIIRTIGSFAHAKLTKQFCNFSVKMKKMSMTI